VASQKLRFKPTNVWALNIRRPVAAGTETPVTPEYYHSRRSLALRVSRRKDRISDPISGQMLRFPAVSLKREALGLRNRAGSVRYRSKEF
jgi:hypothetical protein